MKKILIILALFAFAFSQNAKFNYEQITWNSGEATRQVIVFYTYYISNIGTPWGTPLIRTLK